MVGFPQIPTIEGAVAVEKEDLKSQSVLNSTKPSIQNDTFDHWLLELEDFSLSFSDFDSISGWFTEGNTVLSGDLDMADLGGNPVDFGSVKGEVEASKESFEVSGDGILEKDEVQEELGKKEGASLVSGIEKGENGIVERSFEVGSDEFCERTNMEGVLSGDGPDGKLENLGSLVEKQLGKVSLDGSSNCLVPVVALGKDKNVHSDSSVVNGGIGSTSVEMDMLDGSSVRIDSTNKERGVVGEKEIRTKTDGVVSNEDESDNDEESASESLSSSSSSSSSSGSDEEDEDNGELSGEEKAENEKRIVDGQIDIEEGEIMSPDPHEMVSWSDVEDDGSDEKGPIRSKNELKVLPPVPSVTVTLLAHHQTLPVGTVLSIVGAQVIVEGAEKHNPLNEGSILWITENRLPLGIIDEIFGPVKNPYYIVRYNSESEVPTGIQQGTSISFVQEFASHILNDKNLYQKGYDASGEHDEELLDAVEFSDDEEEAEYKRNLKMKKRGKNKSKPHAERNEKGNHNNKLGRWNHDRSKTPVTEDQRVVPPVATSLNQDKGLSGFRQDLAGDQAMASPYPHMAQAPALSSPNGIWFPPQQQQSTCLPPGRPANGMLWMQQHQPYPLYQAPSQPGVGFQHQMSMMPGGLPLNFDLLAGQSNFGLSSGFGPWPTSLNENMLNPLQFAMGLQAQQSPLPLGSQTNDNLQAQQTPSGPGSQMNHNLLPSPVNLGETINLNQGRGGSGRRGGHQRGRGRFSGGRGRYQRH